jgi:hypothetical protein
VLIVFGDLTAVERGELLPAGLAGFAAAGGNVLLASDRTDPASVAPWGLALSAAPPERPRAPV